MAPTARWTKIPGPSLPRSSHSVCVIGEEAYIFGGEIQARQPVEITMHIIDIASGDYTPVAPSGDAPAPRVGHTGVAVGSDIYVFGGRGGKEMTPLEESGAVYVYSSSTSTWSKISPTSNSYPVARSYHSATTFDGGFVIHGGCPAPPSGRVADTWSFDIQTKEWTEFATAPGKGKGGTAIAVQDEKLLRFGGFDGVGESGGGLECLAPFNPIRTGEAKASKSYWSFVRYGEVPTKEVEKKLAPALPDPHTEIPGPGPRSVTALLSTTTSSGKPRLLVIMGEGKPSPTGGHDAAGNFYDDVWSCDPTTGKWEEVKVSQGEGPGARGWFGADAYGDGAVVWGGLNSDNEREADGWVLKLDE